MPHSRASGLLLIVTGALTFLGTTNQLLPAVTFFPGFAVCALGVVVFLKANRIALEESEKKTLARLNPVIKNDGGDAYAERQAATDGAALDALGAPVGRVAAAAIAPKQLQDDELVLYEVDQAGESAEPIIQLEADDMTASNPAVANDEQEGAKTADFVVTTDVSFPLEIQSQNSLADQLGKLRRLADDGIISEEEFAVAKAKTLA